MKMCPKAPSDIVRHEDSHGGSFVSSNRISPLSQVLIQIKGGQSLYAFICAYIIVLFSIKCIIFVLSEEERLSCSNFFGGQFGSLGYLVQLFIVHHLILYSLVYPAGKYFRHNSFILKCSGLLSIALCKYCLYSMVHIKQDASVTIKMAAATENVRTMMLVISFLCEAHLLHKRKEDLDDISISKFTYFLFAPTLVYRSSYERTNRAIDWRSVARYFFEFAAITFIWAVYHKDLLLPAMERHERTLKEKPNEALASYFRLLTYQVGQVTVTYFWGAFGFLHSYHNATAEVLGFADRNFYGDWWINTSIPEYMRKWNRIVGAWLHEYPYKLFLSFGCNRIASLTLVFVLSGMYHDYIAMASIVGYRFPFFVLIMTISVAMAAFSTYTRKIPLIVYILSTTVITLYIWALIAINFFQL